MSSEEERKAIARVIDANANRLGEGLRVAEDVTRLIFNDSPLTEKLKTQRHTAAKLIGSLPLAGDLLRSRDSETDVGAPAEFDKRDRSGIEDILRANLKRAQESCRVLEECSKFLDTGVSASFKTIRFALYSLEKEAVTALQAYHHENRS